MASKQDALNAIQALKDAAAAEHVQVLAEIQKLKDLANRPDVPDDVVAAINEVSGNISGIFEPEPEPEPTPEEPV